MTPNFLLPPWFARRYAQPGPWRHPPNRMGFSRVKLGHEPLFNAGALLAAGVALRVFRGERASLSTTV
jgi:hypothetical protein